MSPSVAKKLIRYRNLFVALSNAGITWIILIIAPLGLFAVIICTLSVFISSLLVGAVGDFALFSLLPPSIWEGMRARREVENLKLNKMFRQISDRSFTSENSPYNLGDSDEE